MVSVIESIGLERLVPHRDNPNRMSRGDFLKLVRNIRASGRYEPLVVRRHRERDGCFEIINGHHRCKALAELGSKEADCVVWDITDEQADILLVTLNRLCGSDELGKKILLFKRLNERVEAGELSKLLPQTTKQIERLVNMKMPSIAANVDMKRFANPMVFFLNDEQIALVEKALSLAERKDAGKSKAARRAESLMRMAKNFIEKGE